MAQAETVPIDVKGKNIEVTPALRDYAEKRVAKVSKFFQERKDVTVDVLLGVEGDAQVAEVTYRLGGLIMRGESRTMDMYASIDEAADKIERRVRKYKARLRRKLHASPRFGDGLAEPVAEDESEETNEAEAEHQVVRTKRFPVKPMDVDEAIMQMELLGHDFFVFANAASNEINVVYRRKDGRYGLMEPVVG